MPKGTREKFKTEHSVFDDFTNRNIHKLMSEGHIEGLVGPVKVGKESNVFKALNKDRTPVIVKIYRLENCDFNRMYDYIKYDPRYLNVKPRKRQVIFAWTQREFRNLHKARDAGCRVPTPLTVKENILVEEFIGGKEPARQLKDLMPKNPKSFFEDIMANIKKLYKLGLVHADLSAFNILNHDELPVFIDFSQSTPLENPRSLHYLQRDIHNICTYFNKIGFAADEEKAFRTITLKKKA